MQVPVVRMVTWFDATVQTPVVADVIVVVRPDAAVAETAKLAALTKRSASWVKVMVFVACETVNDC